MIYFLITIVLILLALCGGYLYLVLMVRDIQRLMERGENG